jgi:hypothetical protein
LAIRENLDDVNKMAMLLPQMKTHRKW